MTLRNIRIAAIAAAVLAVAPATAQLGQSDSYKFLEAIRDAKSDPSKGAEITEFLSKPGTTIVNTQDYTTRETALHIVAKRNDVLYTRFLLQKGADPNLRDIRGNTPLLAAVSAGADSVISYLIKGRANVNLANKAGETPLIRAVQLRNVNVARDLLAAGADPDQVDNIAGRSARDYASEDKRFPAIAELFTNIPKRDRRASVGPSL
ncbi:MULTISPECIES: ankyrin repeat domain-containing protein [Sphingomonas]|uniref:ankyrin repeat domain-containing protein n=1 Tax=Sphingomonas TaxID=13687 RepID=UPI00082D0F51|nr:ankyrin repeat domain-containing protein [Sphingomonas sp. CCH10-B3]